MLAIKTSSSSLLTYLQSVLSDESSSLTEEQRAILSEDCLNDGLSIETISIIYNLVKDEPGKFASMIRGNTISLSGFSSLNPMVYL